MAGSEIIVSSDILDSTSELWVIKTLVWFRTFDVDRKGYFIKEEIDKMFGERMKKYLVGDEVDKFNEAIIESWEHGFAPVAVNHGGRTVVTWYDFLEFTHSKCKNQDFLNGCRSWLRKLFAIGDKNNDGMLTSGECSRLLTVYGFTERELMVAKAVIDKECRREVTIDGYVENWIEHFYTFDWNASTMAFGYLANVKVRASNTSSIRYNVEVPKPIVEEMGELWVRKLLTFFRHYDVDGTGVIDWNEASRIIQTRLENKLVPGQLQGMIAFGKIFWDMVFAPIASPEEGKTTFKWADFIQSRYEAASKKRPVDEKLLGDFHAKAFDVIDANHDSSIQLEEYLFLTAVRGLSRHQAVVSFANIDINADGTISYAESLEAWRCFLYSKEWGSGTLLYGALDNARIN